jgi:tetratricopeptide (TPR) repeat protein
MKSRNIYIIIAILTVFTFGCATSKSFYKKGQKLESAGLIQEAANNYYVALQKNRNNVDAQIGLKGSGQAVLNNFLQEFALAKGSGQKKAAIQAWDIAMDYNKKVEKVGVKLNVPDFYKQDYQSIKSLYLDELYEEGLALMDEEKYKEAEAKFTQISRLDPDFQDAKELLDLAYVQPLYEKGVAAFENEKYREAFGDFVKIEKRSPNYRETGVLKNSALELGTFTIALLPFENSTPISNLESKISAYSLEALTSVQDPFLKIVDRDHMQLILEEQKLGLTGIIDENSAVTVGELIGAQAIVTGTVLGFEQQSGRPQSSAREGYEQYKVKQLDKETNKYYYETKYKKTSYKEFTNSNRVTVSFQFKVISLKTGEVMLSKIVDKETSDSVNYGEYAGDLSLLYPSTMRGVNTSSSAKKQLNNLINANRQLKSVDELSNLVFQDVSKLMKSDIEKLMLDLVK